MALRPESLAEIRTIQDRVADHIRQLILDGLLQPGDRLNAAQLAQDLGTSTMPVREALHQLEAEQFLIFHAYRGIFVAQLSPEATEELYVMRAALEEFGVRLAVPRMAAREFGAMEHELTTMRRAIERTDPGIFYSADRAFHEVIYGAARRPSLLKQVRELRARSLRYARLYQGLPGVMRRALAENERILVACRAGDAGLAGRRTRAHVLGAAQRVVRHLRRQEPRRLIDPEAGGTGGN